MPAPPKRAILLVFVLAVVSIAVAGFTSDADAQVLKGSLKFNASPIVFNLTVTLQPGGPALYKVSYLGRTIDTGILVASVNGFSVSGFVQSSNVRVRPCFFQGTYDGTTASLQLDEASCGDGGGIVLVSA